MIILTRMVLLIAGIAVLQMAVPVLAEDNAQKEWIVVDGKLATYLNAKEKEVVLQGTLIAEYYGKPGERYIRAPYNYWLKTKDQNFALGPNDSVYMLLDKKTIEVKGKIKKNPKRVAHLLVGWIRVVDESAR
jgi:hypothetical protein